MGGFSATADADSARPPSLDLVMVLRRHLLLIVFCGAVSTAGGYLHYVRQPRVFQSAASLLVVGDQQSNLPVKGLDGSRTSNDQGLSTQLILLRSPLVIERAVRNPKIAELTSIVSSPDPAAVLAVGLSVNPGRTESGNLSNEIIDLRFRCGDAQDSAAALKLIIDAYQSFLGETQRSISEETVDLITRGKDSLLSELRKKEAAYNEFRQTSKLVWTGAEGKNIHQERLFGIEAARSNLMIEHSELKAQIESINRALAAGQSRKALALMAEHLAARQSRDGAAPNGKLALGEQLTQLLIEEQLMLDRFGAQHPKVQAIKKRIDVTRGLLAEGSSSEEKEDGSERLADQLSLFLDAQRQELAVLESQREELNSLFESEQALAKQTDSEQLQNIALQAEIARTQQLFEGVVKRLDEIGLVKDAGGVFTQVVAEPEIGVQVAPRLSSTLGAALLLGVAVGLGLGVTWESFHQSFRSLDEISQQLGQAVLGHYPKVEVRGPRKENSQIAPAIVAWHQPQSALAEAYRAIRTSIYFSARDKDEPCQVLQVTSPLPSDGKTTLSSNLAVTMAQSGKRVLLMEADLRRPNASKTFGLARSPGLTAVLRGDAEVDDCIYATEVPNLRLMPVGGRCGNPSELLSSQRFPQLLGVLREKFDYVIIDSAPLLPVTDASVIAAVVDATLLLVTSRKNVRQASLASMSRLQAVGARVLGVVVRGQFGQRSRRGTGYEYNGDYAADHDEYDAQESLVPEGVLAST